MTVTLQEQLSVAILNYGMRHTECLQIHVFAQRKQRYFGVILVIAEQCVYRITMALQLYQINVLNVNWCSNENAFIRYFAITALIEAVKSVRD